jgi:hypothetical protein
MYDIQLRSQLETEGHEKNTEKKKTTYILYHGFHQPSRIKTTAKKVKIIYAVCKYSARM